MNEVLDDAFAPQVSTPAPAPGPVVRRSVRGPDERWPTPGAGYRAYVYVDERPVGYVEVARGSRYYRPSRQKLWVPFAFSGEHLCGPARQMDAVEALVRWDTTGGASRPICVVCGAYHRRHQRSRTEHHPHCPLVTGLFG